MFSTNSRDRSGPGAVPAPTVHLLGRRPYGEVWELQRAAHRALMEGGTQEAIFVCEHTPTITYGKSSKLENILTPAPLLEARGVEVVEIERGGDVTYHGPGQLVVYPILNLTLRRRDVGWYMRTLEEVIIRSLAHLGVQSFRIEGKTGVWVGQPPQGDELTPETRKIASIGVRLSRWCTLHGFALNVFDCSDGFSLINPCGFRGLTTTSVVQETANPPGSLSSGLACENDPVALEVVRQLSDLLFPGAHFFPGPGTA